MTELFTWLGWLVLPAFLLLDLVVRHRSYDAPRGWRLRALAVTAFNFFLTFQIGALWASALPDASLFQLAAWHPLLGALVAVLLYELGHYAYHRAAHANDWLWRMGHQVHHSAESLDAFGAWYLHPTDTFFFNTIAILVFFPVLGLSPEAAAIASAFLAFNAMFQHANIRTPRWVGWFIQRPESHGLHHARGRHRSNYSDLPLWDMVFGTYENPQSFDAPVGFYKGASSRLPEMLVGMDASRPAGKPRRRKSPATTIPARTT